MQVDVDGLGPGAGADWSPAAVATYFCCAEAAQNALKHSGAATLSITVAAGESGIGFSVADDGRGIAGGREDLGGIRGLDDRVAALGGTITVESDAGVGTTVRGFVPVVAGGGGVLPAAGLVGLDHA